MKSEPPFFEQLLESQLLAFFGWWQLGVCAFAFVALLAIWWHIGKRQQDTGQIWLALSVLCWSISGGVELYFANKFQTQAEQVYVQIEKRLQGDQLFEAQKLPEQYKQLSTYQLAQSTPLNGWRSILSLLNSLFILMALPWFRYLPKPMEPLIKSRYWIYIIGLPFLFSFLPTLRHILSGHSMDWVSELDVYYSLLTLGFLGYVLWESFVKRRLILLAWLSLLCILITLMAQLSKLFGSAMDLSLFSAIFKTSLIMIFFALALSWVKELSDNIIPDSSFLSLILSREKDGKGKTRHAVQLQGIPGKEAQSLPLSPTLFRLLLLFVERKKEGEGWLEIKPKSETRPQKTYDIQDHNEVKRLLSSLLDGLFGKGHWTKDLHERPLKEALFEMSEKRERKIRLKLLPEKITLLNT